MKESQSKPFTYYMAPIGGLILFTYIGCVFMTGNITIYLSSYLQNLGYSITTPELSTLLTLQVLGSTIGMTACPFILSYLSPFKYSLNRTLLIGVLINLASLLAVQYLFNYYLILLVYGFCYGLGAGIINFVPLVICWQLFPMHKGRVAGFMMSGFGLGPAIFIIITTALVNPSNAEATLEINGQFYFPKEISDNLPNTYLCIFFIHTCMAITGLVLLLLPGKLEKLAEELCEDSQGLTLMQALKTKTFGLMFFMLIFSLCTGYFIIMNFKTFGRNFIKDDQFLALVGSVGALLDGSLRFIWGYIMDTSSFKTALRLNLCIQCCFVGVIYFIADVKALYFVCIAVLYTCKGGNYVLFIALSEKIFGKKVGHQIIGIVAFCFFFSSLLANLIERGLLEHIGYQGVFALFLMLLIAAFIMLLFFEEKRLVGGVYELEVPFIPLE